MCQVSRILFLLLGGQRFFFFCIIVPPSQTFIHPLVSSAQNLLRTRINTFIVCCSTMLFICPTYCVLSFLIFFSLIYFYVFNATLTYCIQAKLMLVQYYHESEHDAWAPIMHCNES